MKRGDWEWDSEVVLGLCFRFGSQPICYKNLRLNLWEGLVKLGRHEFNSYVLEFDGKNRFLVLNIDGYRFVLDREDVEELKDYLEMYELDEPDDYLNELFDSEILKLCEMSKDNNEFQNVSNDV